MKTTRNSACASPYATFKRDAVGARDHSANFNHPSNDIPLLSVIIPVYNTAQFLERCLDSVLAQTYNNIEIIIVDDCSTDNSRQIIEKYAKENNGVICVTHDKNRGLFHARLSGIEASSGEYIAHLDSDDYVSIDFYRSLIFSIQKNNADMAIGRVADELDSERKIIYNLAGTDISFEVLEGDEILERYFGQEGLNHYWHVVWNKVYKKSLWDKALPYLLKQTKYLIMTEDFVLSTLLFYHAIKISSVHDSYIFWSKHENSSTAVKKLTVEKHTKNVEHVKIAFSFVEDFLHERNVPEKIIEHFLVWKWGYGQVYKHQIQTIKCPPNIKNQLYKDLSPLLTEEKTIDNQGYFYSVSTGWNGRYEEIKKAICNPKIRIVSFDIFDTLVVRPFLWPTDLFSILDDDFRKLTGGKTAADFSLLRIESENKARELMAKANPRFEDITLDEIYDALCSQFSVPASVAEKMKTLEIEAELRFCTVRNAVFELYEMAFHTGKQVIAVSDMYLPSEIIKKILFKNGYAEIEKIYVSSETRKGKGGAMFSHVISDLNVSPEEILHIGDNYESDVRRAQKHGLSAFHFKKAEDVFFDSSITGNLGKIFLQPFLAWQDNRASMNFFGIRVMIKLIANRYFDNPYRSFNPDSDFNADPVLAGYGALGMYVFGIVRWLINNFEEKDYDKVLFVARDGYLPMEAYKILKPFYNNLPQEEYFYTSRKATVPLSIQNDFDIYKLHEFIPLSGKSPNIMLPYLDLIFDIDRSKIKAVCKSNKIDMDMLFESITDYYEFINVIKDNFFDKEKHLKKLDALRRYFNKIITGKTCIFDIGYSAKPEMYLSMLCGKAIDVYFINIPADSPCKHTQKANCKLNTFLDYNPLIFGSINEILFSKLEGSCIGYEITDGLVKPSVEKLKISYQERFLAETVQNEALNFIKDIVHIFGQDIHKLWLQSYYTSMLFWLLFFSSKATDKKIFDCHAFEDDMGSGKDSLVTRWNRALEDAGITSLKALFPNAILGEECGWLQRDSEILLSILASRPFHAGYALMRVSRKMRGGFRCVKEHGLQYTLKLFVKKYLRKPPAMRSNNI